MTREEAIEILKANYPDACFEQLREAVDMAIEALSAQPNLHTACTQLARDIATIIENEKDMRVMLKNAQKETQLAQEIWVKTCMITDADGLQHEVIHYGTLRKVIFEVLGWQI